MYPRPVVFPRTSSNAALISSAVTSFPASAASSNFDRISCSCSSVSARRCDVYLLRMNSSRPCSRYRRHNWLMLFTRIPNTSAISGTLCPSYRNISIRSRRLTFLSFVPFSASFIASYSSSLIWNLLIFFTHSIISHFIVFV